MWATFQTSRDGVAARLRANSAPSLLQDRPRVLLSTAMGATWEKFVADVGDGADPDCAIHPLDTAMRRLQAVAGVAVRGVPRRGPRGRSDVPGADDPHVNEECCILSPHDVNVLTALISKALSGSHQDVAPRARPSSFTMLKSSLTKQFSDHSEVFDEGTQEYMLDLTDAKVCAVWL